MTHRSTDDSGREARLNEILAEYFQAAEAGEAPDKQRFLAQYPGFTSELEEFFADKERFDRFAEQFSSPVGGIPQPTEAPSSSPAGSADEPTSGPGETQALPPGTRVRYFGDYELLEEIARGGMGVVYKARQRSLNRIVALKMILAGQLASEEEVKRFYVEAEAAANLDHPGIVPIYEVGEHENQHYFSMGYVDGYSLATRLKAGPLSPREAAEYTTRIAEAVAYAHQRGVIHRDLKPANVLVDKNGEPRVTDFGLAKKNEGDNGLTAVGQILGTPGFMPPEQASGGTEEITVSADIYSIGAILYNLITGRPPFEADSRLSTLQQVLEQEPVSPRQLNPNVPRDLEAICLKCLEKEPCRRYASASELVDELEQFRTGQPISARPISAAARMWRRCKRKPLVATLSVSLIVVLLAAAISWPIVVKYQASLKRKADTAVKQADQRDDDAQRRIRIAEATQYAAAARSVLQEQYSPGLSLMLALDAVEATTNAGDPPLRAAENALRAALEAMPQGKVLRSHQEMITSFSFSPDNRWLATASDDATVHLWDLASEDSQSPAFVLGHDWPVVSIAFSTDGRLLFTHTRISIKIWDLVVPDPSNSCTTLECGSLSSRFGEADLFCSQNGRWLATPNANDSVRLWDLSAALPPSAPMDLKLSGVVPQDTFVSITSGHIKKPTLQHVSISPDSRWLVTTKGALEIWDLGSEDPTSKSIILQPRQDNVPQGATITPDSRWVVSAVNETSIGLWSLPPQDPPEKPFILEIQATESTGTPNVAISPDSHWLAVVRPKDETAYLWNLTVPDPASTRSVLSLATPMSDAASVNSVEISPDSRWLATSGTDYASGLHLWDLSLEDPSVSTMFLAQGQTISTIGFSTDSRWLVGHEGRSVIRWDLTSSDLSKVAPSCMLAASGSEQFALSSNGRWVASTGPWQKELFLIDLETPSVPTEPTVVVLGHCSTPPRFSSDRRWFLQFRPGRSTLPETEPSPQLTLRLWDLAAFHRNESMVSHPSFVDLPIRVSNPRLSFSDDSGWVAVADGGVIYLWDLNSGDINPCLKMSGNRQPIVDICLSSDHRWLAGATEDQTIRLWNLHSEDPTSQVAILTDYHAHFQTYGSKRIAYGPIAISPNSRWMAGSGESGTVRVWDLKSEGGIRDSLVLRGHEKPVLQLRFSRDGRWLFSHSSEGIQIWDVSAGQPTFAGHSLPEEDFWIPFVGSTAVDNGRWLFTVPSRGADRVGEKNAGHLWDLKATDPTREPIRLVGHESPIRRATFSDDGQWLVTASFEDVRLWDLAGDPPRHATVMHARRVESLAISPGSRWLTGRSVDGRLLWDLTGKKVDTAPIVLSGPNWGDDRDTFFTADNKRLVAQGPSNMCIWSIDFQSVLNTARRVVPRRLNNDEQKRYVRSELPVGDRGTVGSGGFEVRGFERRPLSRQKPAEPGSRSKARHSSDP